MNGKSAVFLRKIQKEQPDRVKQIVRYFTGMHRLAVNTYITAIQSHMRFINIRHRRKKNHIAVRILKNGHLFVLQQHLSIGTAVRRYGQKIDLLIRSHCRKVCAKSIKGGTHKTDRIV